MAETEEKYTGSSSLSIRISGDGLNAKEGYDLDAVLSSLKSAEDLVRKTYLAAYDRSRFRENDADNLNIKLMEWREGSLWSDLEVQLQSVVLPVLPFVVDNREFIWESIKDSYAFLKAKFKAEKEGKRVQLTQTAGAHGVNVAGDNNTINITVDPNLLGVAEKICPAIQSMTENIDGKRVREVNIAKNSDQIVSAPDDTIKLETEDKTLFGAATFTSDQEVEITGKIVASNYGSNSGKIKISASAVSEIEVGHTYSVQINKDLHAEDKWKEMFLTERPYFCRYKLSGTNFRTVSEIIITDWDESKW